MSVFSRKKLFVLLSSALLLPALSSCVSGPAARVADKTVLMESAGQKYIAGSGTKTSGWLDVAAVGSPAPFDKENTISTNLTDRSPKQWTHFNSGAVEEAVVLKNDAAEKVAYLKIKCSPWYKADKDYDVYHLEANLTARKDLPCLIVRQRVRNTTSQPQNLNFGSYTSGVSEWGLSGSEPRKIDPANKAWIKIVNGDYVWLKNNGEKHGLGVISLTPPGFSLFLGHRIFWGYGNNLPVAPGACLETTMAVMPADNPEEVRIVAEKLKGLALGPFLAPK